MTWILILTLYADAGYSKGAAIGAVGGFDSQAACIHAAGEWRKRVIALNAQNISAVCVPSSVKP